MKTNNNNQVKYFLYARRSSEENKDRQVQSIDDQVNRLRELAKQQNIKIVKIFTESKKFWDTSIFSHLEDEAVSLNFYSKDDLENDWQKEWKDMPEFIQEDLTSHRKIVIHFRNDADVKKFAELIGQKISPKQTSLWFPEMPPRR
jgi:predicted site-specific integrase-resolvase